MFALTETWCHFNIDLNLANFGMYQSPAVKSSDKGRGSGGIILGINKQLQPQIDNVEIETSWIAVTLNPSLDNDSPAICVIFVYLPPNDTHATKLGRLFHLMENKIYNGFEIILVGDLNVRIGNLGGYHNLIDTSNLFSTTRNSCDLTKSAKAEIFIDFLDKNHLTIINGRSINDKSGKFTFISGRGSSVLDLAIVSPAVLEHIADFEIGCMPYSDHLPIILKFIGPNNKTENCYMEPKAKIKFSWSVDKIPTYIETLKELTPEHPADSTIDTQAEDFTGLIQTAMLRSGTRMEAKTKNIKSKPWFDKDCYLAKKEMKQNLKLYVKHNISADKIAYLSSKKKYSAILKLKKREYTDKIQVILSNVKDPSQFWKTINSLKYRNNLQGEISTADWQVFYRELLGSNLTKVVQLPLEILDIDPELDCEISLTEVTKEISKLVHVVQAMISWWVEFDDCFYCFEVLEHPAYSPDLAPFDYFLFGLLKKELKGKRFDSDEDVQKVVQDFFHTLPKSAYKEGIYKLPERWTRFDIARHLKSYGIRTYYKNSSNLLTSLRHPYTKPLVPMDPLRSDGAVYSVSCEKCSATYVGETGRTVAIRMSEHSRNISNCDSKSLIYQHIQDTGHTFNITHPTIPYRSIRNQHQRLILESIESYKQGSIKRKIDLPEAYHALLAFM
ncbi:hypothetical protein LAZ67_2004613 [Cordylochernes scorpioides]|uniref:Endonuclease/exonuclease/phosphatase domain-containing protein n=1 Tax=Cordylochernes scorpioides TaxID=51811 RepID=A0ABY6K3X1_9ARAC|nr:hypothetical protein LAZ67_2004613 [Cordylochernes scorpioides]